MSSFKLQTTLLLLSFLITNIHCQTNQYIEDTGPNGEDIWRSTSDFIPVQSQSYGTIKIGRTMTMQFDFIWWGRTNDPREHKYEMFFRVGFNGTNGNGCDGQGARYPSFWLTKDIDTMHVSVSDGATCQPSHNLGEYGTITIGTSYHVDIEFNDTLLMVEISGPKPKWSKQWNRTAISEQYVGQTVPVWWMSNKYCTTNACVGYNRGNGTFSNVTITSYDFATNATSEATIEPTAVSTTDITTTAVSTALSTDNPSVISTTVSTSETTMDVSDTSTAVATSEATTGSTVTTIHTTEATTVEPTSGSTTGISTTYPITTSAVPATSATDSTTNIATELTTTSDATTSENIDTSRSTEQPTHSQLLNVNETISTVHTTRTVTESAMNNSAESIVISKKTKITFHLPFDILWVIILLTLPFICIICCCFAICYYYQTKHSDDETKQSKDSVVVTVMTPEMTETDESSDNNEEDEEMKAAEIGKKETRRGTDTMTHTLGNHTMMDTIEIVNHPSKLLQYEESNDSNMYSMYSGYSGNTESRDSMHHRSGAIHQKQTVEFRTMIVNEDIDEMTDGTEDTYDTSDDIGLEETVKHASHD